MGQIQQTPARLESPPPGPPLSAELVRRILAFCQAQDARARQATVTRLVRWIQRTNQRRSNHAELTSLLVYLETNPEVRNQFAVAWALLLNEVRSLALLAETGIPSDHALITEVVLRLVAKVFPSARHEMDASRLLLAVYRSKSYVRQFGEMPPELFARLAMIVSPPNADVEKDEQRSDLRDALRLLATRVSWLGLKPEMRTRNLAAGVSDSPFYELLRRTEDVLNPHPAEARAAVSPWLEVVGHCRQEIGAVHRHMESAGVSVEQVFDLKKIEACFARMEALVAVLCPTTPQDGIVATQHLLRTLMAGLHFDHSLGALLHENLDLIARKMVEHTGESGEHYIARDRSEYWLMWRAAIGGGLLTVLTAAIKMRIVDASLPPFIEGFASGTNYAVSFVLLQVFGLVLATKQPAATAATFAGIVRDYRGAERSSKIADFVSRITSTQLAAAIGNVFAVSAGALVFERLWVLLFAHSYLPEESAVHVYQTLHPFESKTALYAIITGLILWMAALIGGWCENFAAYYRIPRAVAQHPLGDRLGSRRMVKLARGVERNLGGWSTSVVLGYLLGFAPVAGHFFGLPIDVRHVTLSSGTLALAVARFGTESLGQAWFYHAVAGIGLVFILNLGVSFTVAGMVALLAYDVSLKEQLAILRALCWEAIRSPLKFVLPVGKRDKVLAKTIDG